MSPVRATCVPPQNSFDSPIVTTRTVSPYFSPKNAIAPACLASAIGSTAVSVAALRADARVDQVLDALRFSSSVSGAKCEKSKRRRSGATSEPFWVTCVAEHVAQRPVQQVRRRVVARGCRRAARRRPRGRPCRRRAARPSATSPRWTHSVDTGRLQSRDDHLRALADAERAGVADLAALLAVERRLGDDDRDVLRVRPDRVDLACRRRPARRSSTCRRSPRSRGTSSAPTRSAIAWNTPSTATSPEPWNSLRSRCSSIARLEAGLVDGRSRARSAMTRVRSSGKP